MQSVPSFHIEWAFTFYYARAHIQCKWMMQIKCLSQMKNLFQAFTFSKENSIQNKCIENIQHLSHTQKPNSKNYFLWMIIETNDP